MISGPHAGPKPVPGYMPYSGSLPAGGVTAPLVVVDPTKPLAAGSLKGKVALFDVPVLNATLGLFEALATRAMTRTTSRLLRRPTYGTGTTTCRRRRSTFKRPRRRPRSASSISAPHAARGSYFPYDGLIRAIPGIFVDRVVGAQLRQVAAAAGTVRVELEAQVATVKSRNVLGVIPGASKEMVAINCHTDGTNGLEDNGPIAIVAIAQYLARIPRHLLPRTILVLPTTCHFAGRGRRARVHQPPPPRPRTPNRGVCDDRASRRAGVASQRHRRAASHRPKGGRSRLRRAQPSPAQRGLCRGRAGQRGPHVRNPPLHRNPHGADNDAAWPGEGSYLWRWSSTSGGVPNANYITGPTYLLNGGIKTIDKIDFTRMRNETIAFAEMLLKLSRIPARTLYRTDIAE